MTFIFQDINNVGSGFFGAGTATTNLTPANSGEAVFRLKELLKAANWVVQASSDSSNFSNTAGNLNDQITTATEMNTAGAWIVLKAPNGRQIGFRKSGAAGQWIVVYYPLDASNVAQVAGTPGTSTALPIFAIQRAIKGTLPSTADTWFGTDGAYRFSCGADNASPYGFYSFTTVPNTAIAQTHGGALLFDPLQETVAEDNDPYVLYCPQRSSESDSPWLVTSLGDTLGIDNNPPYCHFRKGLSGEVFTQCAAGDFRATNLVIPGVCAVNPFSLKDDLYPLFYIRNADRIWPAGRKGRSTVLRWKGAAWPSGKTLNLSTTNDRVVVGDVVLPWDGSTYSV